MKRLFSRMWWHFDRIFGNSRKTGLQFTILLSLTAIVVLFVGGVGILLNGLFTHDLPEWLIFAISLVFDAHDIPLDNNIFPQWWQLIAILLGTLVFSGATITFLNNWMNNRLDAYRQGTVRYRFKNHLVFLGGSRIILPMMKEIWNDASLRKLHIVVLTGEDVENLRSDISHFLPYNMQKELKITILSGHHYDRSTLESIYLQQANRLYIVGDQLSKTEHDSENAACWELAKELLANRKNVPCQLYFNNASSIRLFQRRTDTVDNHLDTTILYLLESMCQKVLVHNGTENTLYPALDRDGIGADDDRRVHLVICGMSDVAIALASAAAHLCHFPNCIDKTNQGIIASRRTKITFVAPDMKLNFDRLSLTLSSLFQLSHYSYITENETSYHEPEQAFGDFLDIEWEFVDGDITDPWVIERLKGYYHDCVTEKKSHLTMAFCDTEQPDRNVDNAVFMPSEFHKIERKDDNASIDYEKTIPLLVYQPQNEEMVRSSGKHTSMYANILSFGSLQESYYDSIQQRIAEGKRINYIYGKGASYNSMTANQDELDDEWRKRTYLEQTSNIYCANHIGVKQRSIGRNATPDNDTLMSVVEHNRWNMEKLLMGYEALEQDNRRHLKELELANDTESLDNLLQQYNRLKKECFTHYCIAPFNELLNRSTFYDNLIVNHLNDIILQS